MKQISKVQHLLIFALFLAHAYGDPTNSTWNYDNGGNDWGTTYPKCTSPYAVESPVDFDYDWATLGGYFLYNWADDGFSYLPDTTSSKVNTYGFDNWVYQMSDFDSVGGFYAAEPLSNPQNAQLYWQIDNIRFHHPAEHLINGTQYDLEMQIFGTDYYDRHVICTGKGATSIFFKVDAASTNTFFDWQAAATAGTDVTIDLSLAMPKTTSATANIYGYDGTDTMPGCDNVCWFVVEEYQSITQAQLDFFTYQTETSNARVTGLGVTTYTTMFFWYGAFAPTPTPKPATLQDTSTAEEPMADL